jgi:hypothetical protein
LNAHFPDTVEDCDAGAEERSVFRWIGVGGDAHCGFGAEGTVFGVCCIKSSALVFNFHSLWKEKKGRRTSPIPRNPINLLLLTHLKKPPIATLTHAIMRAMPASSHTVSYFPFLFSVAEFDDGADDFMAGNTRECVAEMSLL